jgi:hypothetical protein
MECLHCHKEFSPARSGAKFCSNTCRTKHHISAGKNGQVPTIISQNPTPFFGLSGNPSFDYIFQKTERENEELKSENRTLREKLETEKEKFRDLKLTVDTQARLTEADKALESSKGLGGFVDKVTSNDRLMGVLEKIALAKLGVSDESGEDLLEGVEENKMLLQTVISLISEKDQEFLAHFVKVTQWFATNPELLVAASNNINKAKKIHEQKTA